MEELILSFLSFHIVPEQQEHVFDSLDVIEQFGYQDTTDYLNNIIQSVESNGYLFVVDEIIALINSRLSAILQSLGITVDEEVNYIQKKDLIVHLLELENLDDTEGALEILNSYSDTNEALAELLEYITSIPAEEYLIQLDVVSPAIITKLRELYNTTKDIIVEEDDQAQLLATKVMLFKKWRDFTHDEFGLLTEYFRKQFPFLLPFEVYMEELAKVQNDTSPFEDISLAVISIALVCDSDKDPITTIKERIELLDPNIGIANRIEVQCRQVALDFQKYLQSNKGTNE